MKHGGVVSGENDGNAVTEESRERVFLQCGVRAVQLASESAGADIADGANFQRNSAIGENIHQRGIVHSGNAVANALDAENFHGFADFVRATNLAGVNEAMQAGGGSVFVDGKKFFGRDAEFVAADAESDDLRSGTVFCGLDNSHSRVGAELTDGVKNPADGEAARFERLGGPEDGSKVVFRRLVAEKHDTDRERNLGVNNLVPQELFAKVAGDERVVGRIAQKGRDPFEGIEEAEKVVVVVAAADFDFGGGNAVAARQSADGGGVDRTFQVQVQLSLWQL